MNHLSIKRLACLAACAALVTVTFFSTLFVVKHINHTCHQQDCAICLQIHAAKRIIQTVSSDSHTTSGLTLLLAWACVTVFSLGSFVPNSTLISHKIRMNN